MDAHTIYSAKPAPDEIRSGLDARLTATVGTHNEDGSIHLAFVLFLWHDDRFWFETSSTTRKARNLGRDATASIAIDGPGFMVLAEGHGRLVQGARAEEVNDRLRRKYLTEAAAGPVGSAWASVDDVAVEITPVRWRSWSNSKLMELSAAHAGELPMQDWWIGD